MEIPGQISAEIDSRHLTNGPLSHILRNRHYLGEINHHGRSWSGEHPAIIDPETFEKVQARLGEQRVARAARLKSAALLRGKLFNEAGERLTPAYAVKAGVRYGYYVSTSAMRSRDRAASSIHRLPAAALETAIVNALRWRSKRVVGMDPQSTPRRTPDRSAVRSSRWRSPRHRNSVLLTPRNARP